MKKGPHIFTYGARRDRDTAFWIFSRIIIIITIIAILFPIVYIFSVSIRPKETLNQDYFAVIPKKVTLFNYLDALNYARGSRYMIPLGTYAASIMITVIPILIVFVLFQKWFISGITMGSIKG
ncbi:MAG TPA: hypothetical protein ENI15_12980 [Spirochaetes bacterium]|nr:hypothetical protein [Spirochaetota bacterium]